MKKNDLKTRHLLGVVMLAAAMLFASCDDLMQEEFQQGQGVTNAQLESPDMTKATYKVTGGKLLVTWPYVKGAGGYQVSAMKTGEWDPNLTDSEGNPAPDIVPLPTPEPVAMNDAGDYEVVVDGTSYSFPVEYLCEYEVYVKTIGRKDLNNSDALEARAGAKYLYRIGAEYIPVLRDESGAAQPTDLATLVPILLGSDLKDSTPLKIILEPGGEYIISKPLDFGLHRIYLYAGVDDGAGDYTYSNTRALITFEKDDDSDVTGKLLTAAGLEITGVNFDCTKMKAEKYGVVSLSDTQFSENEWTASKGDAMYRVDDPISFTNCNIKDAPGNLFTVGANAYSVAEVALDNCIAQLDNNLSGDGADIFSGYWTSYYNGTGQAWRGGIQQLTIKNSTIINKGECGGRFIRWANNDIGRQTPDNTGGVTIVNSTIVHPCVKQSQFANNTPNNAGYKVEVEKTIWYDCYNTDRWFQASCTKDIKNSTIFTITQATQPSGTESGYFVVEDPLFNGSWEQSLDLTDDAKGGYDLMPQGATSKGIGDPRWLQ